MLERTRAECARTKNKGIPKNKKGNAETTNGDEGVPRAPLAEKARSPRTRATYAQALRGLDVRALPAGRCRAVAASARRRVARADGGGRWERPETMALYTRIQDAALGPVARYRYGASPPAEGIVLERLAELESLVTGVLTEVKHVHTKLTFACKKLTPMASAEKAAKAACGRHGAWGSCCVPLTRISGTYRKILNPLRFSLISVALSPLDALRAPNVTHRSSSYAGGRTRSVLDRVAPATRLGHWRVEGQGSRLVPCGQCHTRHGHVAGRVATAWSRQHCGVAGATTRAPGRTPHG